jgi:hypothetical protein
MSEKWKLSLNLVQADAVIYSVSGMMNFDTENKYAYLERRD